MLFVAEKLISLYIDHSLTHRNIKTDDSPIDFLLTTAIVRFFGQFKSPYETDFSKMISFLKKTEIMRVGNLIDDGVVKMKKIRGKFKSRGYISKEPEMASYREKKTYLNKTPKSEDVEALRNNLRIANNELLLLKSSKVYKMFENERDRLIKEKEKMFKRNEDLLKKFDIENERANKLKIEVGVLKKLLEDSSEGKNLKNKSCTSCFDNSLEAIQDVDIDKVEKLARIIYDDEYWGVINSDNNWIKQADIDFLYSCIYPQRKSDILRLNGTVLFDIINKRFWSKRRFRNTSKSGIDGYLFNLS